MSTNALIQTSRPTVNEIVSKFRAESYFVDNTFQRRLVWTEKQKVRLIETVLIGYPMPELYLWQQQADPESGSQLHSIVDGQQRITTLVQFVSNEWSLKSAYLDPDNQGAAFANKFWHELHDDEKKVIWDYVVSVRTIPNTVDDEKIRAIFKRLNETDRSLNPQEFRNAEFSGQFITAAEEVADRPIWREWNVFKDSQIRRMADIELSSSLLIFLRRGVVGETTESVNEIYDLYNDEYETRTEDIAAVDAFFQRATTYFEDNVVKSFFTKPIHLYTLFCVDNILVDRGLIVANLATGLRDFVDAYEGGTERNEVNAYRLGSSSRTRSKASRERRVMPFLPGLIHRNQPSKRPDVA